MWYICFALQVSKCFAVQVSLAYSVHSLIHQL